MVKEGGQVPLSFYGGYMPTYTFRHRDNADDTHTTILTISERQRYLDEHPEYIQVPCAPGIGDAMRLGKTKTPDSFNDLLKHVKKSHYQSTIQTR